jgi:FkbM family methyltransferase
LNVVDRHKLVAGREVTPHRENGAIHGRLHVSALKTYAFRITRALLYRGLIPVLSHTGPLDRYALRLLRRLIPPRAFMSNIASPLSVDGLTLLHDESRPSYTVRALALGKYEPLVVETLNHRLHEGMVVLDVGAHLGYHTMLAARLVGPAGRVWAFEPDAGNRLFLGRNIEANHLGDRVNVVPMAVGRASGSVTLHRAGNDSGSSTIVGTDIATGATADDVRVDLTTLDSWAAKNNWPAVNLIKMDIEGGEPDALAGMAELAQRNPALILIVECQQDALERSGASAMRLFDRLRELGFGSILVLDDQRGSYPLGGWSNATAVLRQSRWYPINLCCSHVR